jgi:hypothetical protein
MATVITPNLFRPFELTANDLIFAQHLVETFKIMINEYRYIFNVTKEEDDEEEEILSDLAGLKIEHRDNQLINEDEDMVGEVFRNKDI